MKWLILFLGVLCNATASILIKVAMMPPRKFPVLSDPMSAVRNWPLCLGLSLYGMAFVLYAASLARLPLNVAHPILTTGAVALVATFSFLILREPFPRTTQLGLCFVVIGVALISLGVRR